MLLCVRSASVSLDDASQQEYEVVQRPCGFIYQLQLLSTQGDQYYVGLTGLEFYDSVGNRIELTQNSKRNFNEDLYCCRWYCCVLTRVLCDSVYVSIKCVGVVEVAPDVQQYGRFVMVLYFLFGSAKTE